MTHTYKKGEKTSQFENRYQRQNTSFKEKNKSEKSLTQYKVVIMTEQKNDTK
jgi:hypothetical protein